MTRLRSLLSCAAATALLAAAGPAPAAPSAAAAAHEFVAGILEAHNAERAALGVGPLVWSPDLAEHAQAWADHLAATGKMRHSDNDQRPGEGENLWMGTAGYFSLKAMVAGWSDERNLYRPGVFPDVARTGSWHEVGHWTQMVWSETTQVGCAIAHGRDMDFLVCRYSPPGNVIGERAF